MTQIFDCRVFITVGSGVHRAPGFYSMEQNGTVKKPKFSYHFWNCINIMVIRSRQKLSCRTSAFEPESATKQIQKAFVQFLAKHQIPDVSTCGHNSPEIKKSLNCIYCFPQLNRSRAPYRLKSYKAPGM